MGEVRVNKSYDQELRDTCVRRMMPPKKEGVRALHRETGIPEGTLHRWKAEAKRAGWQDDSQSHSKQKKVWTSAKKFQAVLDTASLNQAEMAEYCRRNGLYVEQLEEWRKSCEEANGGTSEEVSELKQQVRTLQKQHASSKKELRRSQAALAEAAALLVLRKKAQAIWGDPEDE